MDAIILTVVLRTILTVTAVWNTGETGDIFLGDYLPAKHENLAYSTYVVRWFDAITICVLSSMLLWLVSNVTTGLGN